MLAHQPRSMRLLFVGDVLVTRRLHWAIECGYFTEFREWTRDSDVVFGNFETLLHNYEWPARAASGGTWLRAPAGVADDLASLGFTLMSRANNHAMDFGEGAMRLTSDELDRVGISHSGVGRDEAEARTACFADSAGGRVALVSICSTLPDGSHATPGVDGLVGRPGIAPLRYSTTCLVPQNEFDALRRLAEGFGCSGDESGVNFLGQPFAPGEGFRFELTVDERDVCATVRAVREARRVADVVVVSIHSHETESEHQLPAQFLVETARRVADAGADVVVGHGPHQLYGIEIYQGTPILYSLGNFASQSEAIHRYPADARLASGLPIDTSVSDVRASWTWAAENPLHFESVVTMVDFDNSFTPAEVRLMPMELAAGERWAFRGLPTPASADVARRIHKRMKEMSAELGCPLVVEDDVLVWRRG